MNQYLLVCKQTGQAAMIDAGDPDKLWQFMTAEGASQQGPHQITVTKLLQTHAHIDHILGLAAVRCFTF
jgi:glyoxylase-like metal-dependent hydrolase (beta-lactamase superfamily II)